MALPEFPFDAVAPRGMTWPIIRTPMQKTLVQTAASGKEYRTALYPWPRWKWKIDFSYLFDDYTNPNFSTFMFQTLAGFYNQVNGQYGSWLYADQFDSNATNQPAGYLSGGLYVFTGNGSQKVWQLFKQQSGGPLEPVQYMAVTTLFVNGTPTVAYAPSGPPGIVTFTTAPGAGAVVTWTGGFFYLCRFTADSFDFSHDWYGLYSAKSIEFMSVFA
jgi:hypothetical protein